jgi:hypothetical protein
MRKIYVMDARDRLKEFLLAKGFVIEQDEVYRAFGNRFLEMCSNEICIQMTRDRAVESINICNINDRGSFYDLARIKTFLLKEDRLDGPREMDAEVDFIEGHLDAIREAFGEENYPVTKARLEELGPSV